MGHYPRNEMLYFQRAFGILSRLKLLMKLFFTLKFKYELIKPQLSKLDDETCSLKSILKNGRGTTKQQVKKSRTKKGNTNAPWSWFGCKFMDFCR